MRQWLARLGFSFIVLACVLAWQGYQMSQHGPSPGACGHPTSARPPAWEWASQGSASGTGGGEGADDRLPRLHTSFIAAGGRPRVVRRNKSLSR